MAAPAITARTTPTGFKMADGFRTTIAFALKPAIQLWEMTVKPPGFDGGGGIETTTMHSIRYRTKDAKKLISLDDSSFNAMYDPDVFSDLFSMINVNQSVTFHFPDGTAMAVWGFLSKFEPGELKEGEPPMAACTIVSTMWDNANGVEAAPNFQAASGT